MPENNTNTNVKEMDNAELRKILINYLDKNAPDELLKQFCNIVIHTNDYLKVLLASKVTEQSRADYIMRSMDCVNVINKFVAMVGSGAAPSSVSAVTDQTKSQDNQTKEKIEESNKPTQYKIEDEFTNVDDLTPEDIIKEELNNWGINDTTYGYKALLSMASLKLDKDIEYTPDDLIALISGKNNKSINSTKSALQSLVSKADFSKSKYVMLFRSMDKKNITKEMVVDQFYDFIK